MLSYQQAFYQLKQELTGIYDSQESAAIAHELLEHITGLGRLQRLSGKDSLFTAQQQERFDSDKARLLQGEPLQYVTGVQWFLGKPFHVNNHVLIPRPETEELVQWIVDDQKGRTGISILDIGTGSGCIPVSLKLHLPEAVITACDISGEALEVARQNASAFNAGILLKQVNFLEMDNWQQFERYDVIVSNPPYIPLSEKETLDRNVRDYEPGTALFVPEHDALLFYRHIALFGKTYLRSGGAVYCELHKDHGMDAKALFEQMGYRQVILKKDMHGNDRMLKARIGGP